MSNLDSENLTIEDFHFLKGVNDRICSLMEKNIKGMKASSKDVINCMQETHTMICQIMEELEPLDPKVKGQLIAKIAEWER